MNDDELEQALGAPLTSTQVADWCLDAIEQLARDGLTQPDARTSAAVSRLAELEPAEQVLATVAQVGAALLIEMRRRYALATVDVDRAHRQTEHAITTVRTAYRGDG